MKMKSIQSKLSYAMSIITAFISSISTPVHAQSNLSKDHYVKLSNDLTLFYQEAGTGHPLLFIPGFSMPSDVFKNQIAYFSKKYHVIAIDPRSQGRSSVTMENNTYTQRGIDLDNFMKALDLKSVRIVGWSWGCYDEYAYIRLKGTDNIKAFVCIDASPKSSGNKNEWAFADYSEWGNVLIHPLIYNRRQFTAAWAQGMVERHLTPEESNWFVSQAFHTPTYAAIELATDAIYADYRPEAILLNEHDIPTLNFVSKMLSENAKKWLRQNTPHSEIQIMGKHLMFWEHPNQFNAYLDAFLNKVK